MIAIDTTFPPGRGYAAFATLMEDLCGRSASSRRVDVPEALWRVAKARRKGAEPISCGRAAPASRCAGSIFMSTRCRRRRVDGADPFQLTREGERLIGLGAADMKGTIAAVAAGAARRRAIGVELGYDPMLLFCTDEEGGLYPGVRYLAEQGCSRATS